MIRSNRSDECLARSRAPLRALGVLLLLHALAGCGMGDVMSEKRLLSDGSSPLLPERAIVVRGPATTSTEVNLTDGDRYASPAHEDEYLAFAEELRELFSAARDVTEDKEGTFFHVLDRASPDHDRRMQARIGGNVRKRKAEKAARAKRKTEREAAEQAEEAERVAEAEKPSMTSSRPYLVRALHGWIADNDMTPYLLAARGDGVDGIPDTFFGDGGTVVLDISAGATDNLVIGDRAISFGATFDGTSRDVRVPMSQVRAIYAHESGKGMTFGAEQ